MTSRDPKFSKGDLVRIISYYPPELKIEGVITEVIPIETIEPDGTTSRYQYIVRTTTRKSVYVNESYLELAGSERSVSLEYDKFVHRKLLENGYRLHFPEHERRHILNNFAKLYGPDETIRFLKVSLGKMNLESGTPYWRQLGRLTGKTATQFQERLEEDIAYLEKQKTI